MTAPATIAEFKTKFARQFAYGSEADSIMDGDLESAMADAEVMFNPGKWVNDAEMKLAFLYLSAHFLRVNTESAGGLMPAPTNAGMESMTDDPVVSKSVGGVSVNYALPPSVTESPVLAPFMSTPFGKIYLQFLAPKLTGVMMVIGGSNDTSVTGYREQS